MNNRQLIDELDRPRTASGFRVMKGEREFVTYQKNATVRVWYGAITDMYEMHYHSAVEICLPTMGGCQVTTQKEKFFVREGEVLIIPPGEPHALKMDQGCARYLIIFEMNGAFTMKEFSALRALMLRTIYLDREEEVTAEVHAVLMDLVQIYESYSTLRNLHCYARLLDMYALLGEKYLPRIASREEMSAINRISGEDAFNRALEYVNKNYAEDITLDSLADYAGFSRYTLSRMFTRHTGNTFTQYLNTRRVSMAAELLSQSDLPVTQVALRVGFGSIATFNRVFRAIRGCTPSQFRNVYSAEKMVY